MRVLIVGSGGREHALTWALQRETPDVTLFATPGNPGTAQLGSNLPFGADDIEGILGAVDKHDIDLTVVGPEIPLALGLADRLREWGRPVFGPSAAAARIEASKVYAKGVMERARVPTAASRTFTDAGEALSYLRHHPEPLVVKASGLAGGKGALVCATREEAARAVRLLMEDHQLGEAGNEILIEEFMEGEELSVFALTNGREIVLLPSAQDHKRLQEGDAGPNTGGMGAYSPVSLATPELLRTVERTILVPTLAQMERENTRFSGLLYAGLMIGKDGPRVVEFNCRFGDPETQAILPLLSGGLGSAIERVARGEAPTPVRVRKGAFAVTTVVAAGGYPDRPEKGAAIRIPPATEGDVIVFHAGTVTSPTGELAVSGGRVLAVTGVGTSFPEAQERSRRTAESIQFDGKVYRRDIGWREARRL
jgi:phosphoribosylamine---glycine ligase